MTVSRLPLLVALLVLASTLSTLAVVTAAEDKASSAQAAKIARSMAGDVRKLRKYVPGCKDAKAELARLMKKLQPHEKNIRKVCLLEAAAPQDERAYAHVFNELVLLMHYHRARAKPGFIVRTLRVAKHRLLMDVPVSRDMDWKWGLDDQHVARFIVERRPKGTLRVLNIHRYKWNTTYSGTGGENAKKLAETLHKLDRDIAKSHDLKASKRVKVTRLNRHFSRSYYYWANSTEAETEAPLKTRNWYIKGKTATFCLDVIDHLQTKPSDDPVTRWQVAENDVLMQAMLASIRPNAAFHDKKKPRR